MKDLNIVSIECLCVNIENSYILTVFETMIDYGLKVKMHTFQGHGQYMAFHLHKQLAPGEDLPSR